MLQNWKTNKISEVFEIIGGGTPKTTISDYWNGSIPWLSVVDFNNDVRSVYKTEKTITEIGLKNSSTKLLKKGQLIISARGTVGQIAQLKKDMAFNQSCYGLNGLENILINDYGYYLIKYSVSNIQANTHGSVFDTITRSTFENIEVNIPPLPEQKAIAQILSAIDDKIENNLDINKTLEEMARALYKHWFVDFGPFQDGAFVESELGEIPEGWEVKTLGELSKKLSKGTTPKMKDKGDLECTIPFLKVKDLNDNGEIDQSNIEYIPETIHLNQLKRSVLENEDLLFSIAGTIGRVSIIHESLDNSNCNQALAFIRLKDKEKLNTFVYNWLKSEETQQKIESSIVQGVQANVSLTVLKELDIIIPSELIVENFSKQANPIHDKILENQVENQTLTQLRDTLLPKLISGEVRLKEFREAFEEVE